MSEKFWVEFRRKRAIFHFNCSENKGKTKWKVGTPIIGPVECMPFVYWTLCIKVDRRLLRIFELTFAQQDVWDNQKRLFCFSQLNFNQNPAEPSKAQIGKIWVNVQNKTVHLTSKRDNWLSVQLKTHKIHIIGMHARWNIRSTNIKFQLKTAALPELSSKKVINASWSAVAIKIFVLAYQRKSPLAKRLS